MKLEELKKLCDEATPGPWKVMPRSVLYYPNGGTEPDFSVLGDPDNSLGTHLVGPVEPGRGDFTVQDALFISAACTFMPVLLEIAEAVEQAYHAVVVGADLEAAGTLEGVLKKLKGT